MDKTRNSNVEYGLRNPAVEGENKHWEKKKIKEIDYSKPTLFAFGGNGTIDPRKANNVCRVAESLVGLKIGDVDSSYKDYNVVGVSYGRDNESDTTGTFTNKDVANFIDDAMIGRFFDADGKRFDLETAKKNMSQVKFCTHCYGSVVVSMIMSKLNQKMLIGGYSKEEISDIYAQTFQLTYSPYTNHVPIPTVRVDSFIDSHHKGFKELYKSKYGTNLSGIAVHYDEKGMFRGEKSSYTEQPLITIWSSQLRNTAENSNPKSIFDEHAFDVSLELGEDYKSKNGAKNAEVVAHMAGCCLAEELVHAYNNSYSDKFVEKHELKDYLPYLDNILEENSAESLAPSFNMY